MMAGGGADGRGGEENYRMVVKEASDALELAPHHAKALYRFSLYTSFLLYTRAGAAPRQG